MANYQKNRTKILTRYGLSEIRYNAMFASQQGHCIICNLAVKLVIDHDHVTGKVRGLLCRHCNLAVGFVKDNYLIACNLARYLGPKHAARARKATNLAQARLYIAPQS